MTTTTDVTAPAIIDGLPNADYHAHPALGSTSLKTLATRTPAHYRWQRDNPQKPKDAFDLGTVVHSLTLEGTEDWVWVVNADDWTTKKAKEERDAVRSYGFTPLLAPQMEQARAMRDSILSHPIARAALTGHRAEASVFWEEDGLELKCRPDAWIDGIVADLKTTVNADPRKFGKTAYDLGYHQSEAHYSDGIHAVTGERPAFVFILAEKDPPYLVSVVELDPDAVELGRRLNTRAKDIYRRCAETGTWPGYETTEPVRMPAWANYRTEEILND